MLLGLGTATPTAGLDLLVPGLFGPLPLAPEEQPATPALDRLLAGAVRRPCAAAGLTTCLWQLLAPDLASQDADSTQSPPSAPYCLAADEPDWDRAGYWLHADPVHLRADRDCLRLFDVRYLQPSASETARLIVELNAHFATDGLHFRAPLPTRWYLRAPEFSGPNVAPLAAVSGQAIDWRMPAGPAARLWNRRLNEAQMLLHASAVNREREATGQPAINGIWIWGGGTWRAPRPVPGLTLIMAEHPLARGLASATGIATCPLETAAPITDLLAEARARRVLVAWDRLEQARWLGGQDAWRAAVGELDVWLAPLLTTIRRTRHSVRLRACDGVQWHLGRRFGWPKATHGTRARWHRHDARDG